MQRLKAPALFALALSLAGCVSPTEPQNEARIEHEIVVACLASPLFKAADGVLTAAVPAATLPVDLVNAGVDIVCGSPALFAHDASTVEWVAKNLAGRI